jgi:amino acid adenylation domain-containing protein/non-ribosomal peptide synthase protein (TIGR01720 family)
MRTEPTDRYPLAPPQRSLLAGPAAATGLARRVEQHRLRLDGALDLAAFRAAWAAVCERHAVLRTRFDLRDPEHPGQAVLPAVPLPLVVEDWRDRNPAEPATRLRQRAEAERQRGFDLTRAPLFRLRLVRLADRSWQFLWTYHQLILDGASAGIVLADLAAGYAATGNAAVGSTAAGPGGPPDRPATPAYRDVVSWAGERDPAPAREYWTGALAGFTEPTALGIARPGNPERGPDGWAARPLPEQLADQLAGFARDHGLTLPTLLAGAWAVLLGRYAGTGEVLFGVACSGRSGPVPGSARLVGRLSNPVPTPVELAPDRPVMEWLRDLHQEQSRRGQQALTPLDQVHAWSRLPAGRRLFDSLLVVEDLPVDQAGFTRLGDLRVSEPVSVPSTGYPLTLLARPHRRLLEAVFDPASLDPWLVRRLLGHLEAVLAGLLTAPVLGELEPLRPAELAELAGRGAPRGSVPVTELAPARFAGWTRRTPDRIAVCAGDHRVTYRELGARVARLAHRLRGLGVGPGALVGICLPRGVDLVTAVLAVASAGGGYLPVDPRDPPARVRGVLADASVAVLVTHRQVAAGLARPAAGPATLPTTVELDDPAEQSGLAGLPAEPPPIAAGPHDLAYVIYTSGSTGAPKGVMVEHAQLARLFDATGQWFRFGPDDVWTLFHSIAFDFSVWELWGALTTGGRLVVVPTELTRDPAGFRELLLAEGITVLNQTPSSFQPLLHADLAAGGPPAPYRLRYVIFGGERLAVASLRPWLDRYGDQRPRLVNMYGITETTVHVTYHPVRHADLAAGVPSPIGEPLPDLAIRLVDPHGRPVPVGVPGEILVGGAGVARGYLRRPELTADRFPEEPAKSGPRRWYRTGDRARWLPAGGLEYLGRVDDQLKVRGYRIEPGEIESVLAGHPQIRAAVVVARDTGLDGHRQLVAYLVPEPGCGMVWPAVREWLAERLPEHLVPAGAVQLDRLPLTPNGKVDRAALPAPGPGRPDGGGEPAAPRTGTEAVLAEVMGDVLGLDPVGVADNFFALGGDSILAIQVAVRARRRGVAITPAQLFAHQSAAELATVAEPAGSDAGSDAGSGAEQGEVTGEVPATPAQAWFHRLDLPHPAHWTRPVLLAARQPVGVDRLGAALAALVAHHDLLRLRVATGERPRQWIVPVAAHGAVPVHEFDLTGVDARELDRQIDRLARQVSGGLDLAAGPLLLAAVFHAPAGEPDRVLLAGHQLVLDAASWQVLLADLATAYRQLAEGEPVRLPPKTTAFARWARDLTELAHSARVAEEAAWWLAALPERAPELPVDGDPDTPNREGDAGRIEATLDEPTTRALLALANQAYRTSTSELLLAALAAAVAGWSGTRGVLVDVAGHGRDLAVEGADVARTVGWFTTITPTWLDLSDLDLDQPGELIRYVKERLRSMPRRGASYGLARWLREDQLARRLAELPAAQLSFHHLGQLRPGPDRAGAFTPAAEPAGGARHPANPRPYLLDVVTGVRDGRLRLHLTYSRHHHTPATARALLDAYLAAVRELIRHCTVPGAGRATPSDFPLARVDQRQLDRLAATHHPIEDLYPLTPLQRGLLFHTLANPRSGVYFEQFSIELAGTLDVDALTRAWTLVHERHAVLRSAVAWQGFEVPLLVVRERVELPLTHHDWGHLPETEQAPRLAELLARDRTGGFDLSTAPLTRLHLVELGPRRWNMVWSHHHILLDRWSIARLIQEIFDTYQDLRTGRHVPGPPPRPFRDYVAYLAGLDRSGAPAYWRRVLAGVSRPTPLGGDRPAVRAGRRDADYARLARRLSAADSAAVRRFTRDRRITVDTVLHGAWALVLASRSGLDDVVFAVTSAGRPAELAGVEEMIGLFINTFPARVRVNRREPVGSWLAGLMRDQVEARQFEHTPLEQIRGWSEVPPDQPLFESGRALVNFPWDGSRYRTGDLTIRATRTFEQASFGLSFVVVPEEELHLQLWYDALRFAPETADQLLASAGALILALVRDPDRPLGAALAEVPAPRPVAAPPGASLPELVRHWAERQPDRTAVSDGQSRLSYRELDQRADRVAGWLVELGAGPGTRVGVALPRSVDQVPAVLGVLRAGAVPVPVPLPAGGDGPPPVAICLVPDQPDAAPAPAQAPGAGVRMVRYQPARLAAVPPASDGRTPADPAALAWVSGAGGAGPAVELTHRELARRVATRPEISPADVVAQLADPDSEVAAWELWAALSHGAGLAVCPAGPASPTAWWEPAREPGITVLTLTAGELTRLFDQAPQALAEVRAVLLRGRLPAPYARRLRATLPSLTLIPAADLELGRVANRLRGLPAVQAVVVRPDPDRQRLTAYLAADPGALDRGGELLDRLADQHLARWRAGQKPARAAGGAAAAPAGEPAPTLDRLRALGPGRVLELDSGAALDDLPGQAPGSFDLVVLDSVVRHLPGSGHLARLLDHAIGVTAPAGSVFVGDLRPHRLREAYHLAAELPRSVDLLPIEELSARVSRSLAEDAELAVDPAYFTALAAGRPELGGVAVLPRLAGSGSGLTRFRYDVVLRVGPPPPAPAAVRWYDWQDDVLSADELGWLLQRAGADAVGITRVPDRRLARDLAAARLLAEAGDLATAGELRQAAARLGSGVDPEELSGIAAPRGWSVTVGWAAEPGQLTVLFQRGANRPVAPGWAAAGADRPAAPAGAGPPDPTAARLTSEPLRGALLADLQRRARDLLDQALPESAGLTRVVVLPEFPRTARGEVDEAALPAVPEPAAAPAPAPAVPPSTPDELRLARVWQRVLGVAPDDVRTSFFDLGGDSMLAIRLIDEAGRALGRDVPLAVLLQEPTIEGMAAALPAAPGRWTPLVEITPGDGVPFFCAHPAGGTVLCYGELGRLVAPQPFYALQARGVERGQPPDDDLPTMAASYLAAVRDRQATGPYLLGGWSMGGLVAYEMARQLVAAGERVGLLVLMDTPTPELIGELPDQAAALARLLEGVAPIDPDRLRAMPGAQRLRFVLAEAERVGLVPPGLDPDRAEQLFAVFAAHVRAVQTYRPGRFDGPVRLLRAVHSEVTAPDYGWGELLTGQWQTIDVPGTHESMVWPPNVRRLAEVLREQLAAVRPPG